MIKYVRVTNYKDETLSIDIYNSATSGVNIRKIDGLGPVKANITTTAIVSGDGDIYNSARADKRNIVLTLGFVITPNLDLNTIEDVRQMSYKYFPLKSLVKINIETDNRSLYTYGYVESNEPDIFSDDETCQVSIICPDSYFTSEIERNITLDQLKPVFKFPFEVLMVDEENIDLLETDKDYSVQVIKEEGSGAQFNGNIQKNMYYYNTTYMDIEKMTYDNMAENYTYEALTALQ